MDVVAQGRLVVADERRLIGEQDRAVLGQQEHAVDRTSEHPFVDGGEELVVASAPHGTLGIRGDEQWLEHVEREPARVPGRVGLEPALQVPGHAVGHARAKEEDHREQDEERSQLLPTVPRIGHGCPRPCVLPRVIGRRAPEPERDPGTVGSPCLRAGTDRPRAATRRYADTSSAKARKARPRWLSRSFSSSSSSAIVRCSPSGTKIGS